IREQERQLKAITDDQDRLRKNLKEMPPTAAAYKRYLQKFDQQETQIETYQADIKKLQATEHEQQKALDDCLASFSAEHAQRPSAQECNATRARHRRKCRAFFIAFHPSHALAYGRSSLLPEMLSCPSTLTWSVSASSSSDPASRTSRRRSSPPWKNSTSAAAS